MQFCFRIGGSSRGMIFVFDVRVFGQLYRGGGGNTLEILISKKTTHRRGTKLRMCSLLSEFWQLDENCRTCLEKSRTIDLPRAFDPMSRLNFGYDCSTSQQKTSKTSNIKLPQHRDHARKMSLENAA